MGWVLIGLLTSSFPLPIVWHREAVGFPVHPGPSLHSLCFLHFCLQTSQVLLQPISFSEKLAKGSQEQSARSSNILQHCQPNAIRCLRFVCCSSLPRATGSPNVCPTVRHGSLSFRIATLIFPSSITRKPNANSGSQILILILSHNSGNNFSSS